MVETRTIKIQKANIYINEENGHIMADEVKKDDVNTVDLTALLETFEGSEGVQITINKNTLEE